MNDEPEPGEAEEPEPTGQVIYGTATLTATAGVNEPDEPVEEE